jgi:hypothetical protein
MHRFPTARACLSVVLGFALVACVPTKSPYNTNTTRTRTYASARILNLVSDVAAADTILAVKDDLPGGFSTVPSPGVTVYQPVASGDWTAFLSLNEVAAGSSATLTVKEKQQLTLVEAGTSTAATLTWTVETAPTLTSDQSAFRVVVGAPALVGASVMVGTATPAPAVVLGALSDWIALPAAQPVTVVVSLPGQATTFNVPASAAGQLHTFAIVQASSTDTTLRLVDIAGAPGTDATAGTPLAPTP